MVLVLTSQSVLSTLGNARWNLPHSQDRLEKTVPVGLTLNTVN